MDSHATCSGEQCLCQQQYFDNNGACGKFKSEGINVVISRATFAELKGQLNTPCLPGDQCTADHSECHSTKLCVCAESFFMKDGECCESLGSRCDSNKECRDGNSLCRNNLCQCDSNFHDHSGTCGKKHFDLDQACSFDEQCSDSNAFCSSGSCKCQDGFVAEDGVCDEPNGSLFAPCSRNGVCLSQNAVCHLNKCVCPDGFYAVNGECASLVNIGESCSFGRICSEANAVCLNAVCQCKPGYRNLNSRCGPSFLSFGVRYSSRLVLQLRLVLRLHRVTSGARVSGERRVTLSNSRVLPTVSASAPRSTTPTEVVAVRISKLLTILNDGILSK
ncbi:hypothetical protein CAPTEDRAFT_131255 [Capitella teleta]|uniref:EGF-like domain-containing protein n=1 Tax=Capitella teleta TaxID=283909 RepID=R7U3P8_CAPTE|nr:hypothetical protein CAPTEDRAFT_131255 [Capitella teleta]|eukprot:ELU00940.1 hypothetical protein CAPTEDRAFT_131255 [Capitella teleta]